MGKFQLFPEQASTLAPEVDHLLYFLLAITVFFTVLIFGAIFYFAIRYRRRSENERAAQSFCAARARAKISGIVPRSVFGTRPTSSSVAGSYETVSPAGPVGRGPE